MVVLLPKTNAAAKTNVLLDTWDFKDHPTLRATTGRWGAAAMILVAELNDRLTTLGIAVILVTYLKSTMNLGKADSTNAGVR